MKNLRPVSHQFDPVCGMQVTEASDFEEDYHELTYYFR